MRQTRFYLYCLLVAVPLSIGTKQGELRAQAADYLTMGRAVEDNRVYLRFIDQSLSNLDDDSALKAELIPMYQEAMRFDFYAQTWYLEGEYGKTRREVLDARKILSEVYRKLLIEYIDRAFVLLESVAPYIAKAQDKDAKILLQHGFRDLKRARLNLSRGSHTHILQYTDQIRQFREGILYSRRAGRYGLRALVESRLAREEKPQHMLVTLDEAKGEDIEIVKPTEFQYMQNWITRMIQRSAFPAIIESSSLGRLIRLKLFEMNMDNHGIFITGRKSLYLEESLKVSTAGRTDKDRKRMPGDP